jgi:hypothetical protein
MKNLNLKVLQMKLYLKPKTTKSIQPTLSLSNKVVGIEAINNEMESIEVELK